MLLKRMQDVYKRQIETIPKVEEIDLMKIQPEEKTLEEQDCQNKLLKIPGVMLSDVEVRTYELGEAAAHLIGYVQSVTAEDLEYERFL